MKNFKNKYRSQTNRWDFWDYSAPGVYYLTLVTKNKQSFFGAIEQSKMMLSQTGVFLEQMLNLISMESPGILMDEFVIMPDHFHCILIIPDDNFVHPDEYDVDTIHVDTIHELYLHGLSKSKSFSQKYGLNKLQQDDKIKKYRKLRRKMTIPLIMGKLKMQVSKQINIINNTPGATNWQHDYYDTIIRNTPDYKRIRNYIVDNPKNWKFR